MFCFNETISYNFNIFKLLLNILNRFKIFFLKDFLK